LIKTLVSPVSQTISASQAVASVAAIELPQGQWPDLIQTLLSFVSTQDSNVKEASLQTIGFICETIVRYFFY
jgi:importin subunit beta-1